VGVPYNPALLVSANPRKEAEGISIWPQPGAGTLHFGGFAGKGQLLMYDMQGHKAFAQAGVVAGAGLDVSGLPAGVYAYRLIGSSRVWTGRLVIGGR
jgi:hypothetical protein